MNSQDVANRFEQSYQKLSDSLDQGLISGETYDHISNVMCDLYALTCVCVWGGVPSLILEAYSILFFWRQS
jgi:hypothetical protein